MDGLKVHRIPLGDAIIEHLTFSGTTQAYDDFMGLAEKAYGHLGNLAYAVHKVADSLASYRYMWTDMLTDIPPCEWIDGKPMVSPDDSETPAIWVAQAQDFLRTWAFRVHGRDPSLSPDQCWDIAQREFAYQL